MKRSPRALLVSAVCAAVLATFEPAAAFDPIIDSPMYKDPDLPFVRVTTRLPSGAIDLWLEFLKRPEADYRCKAAQTIAAARRRGYNVAECIPALITAFARPEENDVVRLALAECLIALDARAAAAALWKHAQAGSSDLRCLVEPALARWDHAPARAVWLGRLDDAATPQTELILALRGLGAVREEHAARRLRELALAPRTPVAVRLEAAAALGALQSEGLEKDAASLAAQSGRAAIPLKLAAARLLARHESAEAVATLQRLADDAEPAVASAAVARLLTIDPKLIVAKVQSLLKSRDAGLRLHATTILLRLPSAKHMQLLGDALDDPHPEVRVRARQILLELAEKKWRAEAIAEGSRNLAGKSWRALEQAAILLTQLDHKPAVRRLLELLEFERPEVNVTAGWALRRLAVAETLAEVTAHVERHYRRAASAKFIIGDIVAVEHRLAQLNQLLGAQRYQPAEKVWRLFIPKQPLFEARAAAIWSLGLLLEGQSDPALAQQLEERLNDGGSVPPEDQRVMYMSAIALGRLGAKEALASLEKQSDGQWGPSANSNACCWAMAKLRGRTVPPPATIQYNDLAWSLIPHE